MTRKKGQPNPRTRLFMLFLSLEEPHHEKTKDHVRSRGGTQTKDIAFISRFFLRSTFTVRKITF